MSRLFFAGLVLMVGLTALGFAAPKDFGEPRRDAPITVIAPADTVHQWVVDEPSGRVFASLPEKGEVAEFDPDTGKELRRFAVGGTPENLVIKRHRLVAFSQQNTTLSVVDLKENKPAGKLTLPMSKISCVLFCSQADNPYVYVIWLGAESHSHTNELLQIDLDRMQIHRRQDIIRWHVHFVSHVLMSPDGRWALADNRPFVQPTGMGLMEFDEEQFTVKNVGESRRGFLGQPAVNSSGQWWTLGESLYTQDLSKQVRRFRGQPVAIHPTLDLAASLNMYIVKFQGFSDAKPITSVMPPMPQPLIRDLFTAGGSGRRAGRSTPSSDAQRRTIPPDPILQFDQSGQRVYWDIGPRAFVAKLSDLGVRPEARVEMLRPAPVSMSIQQTRRVPLGVVGGQERERKINFTLVTGPKFAKIEGNELVLSPGDEPGKFEVSVKAASGTATDAVNFSVEVGQPNLTVGFPIAFLEVDPSGKYAVVAGTKGKWQRYSSGSSEGDPGSELAVIDLDEAKILGTTKFTNSVSWIAVDEKYVYLTLHGSSVLQRLVCMDLSKRTQAFLNQSPSRLIAMPKAQLAVVSGDSRFSLSTQLYDRETLRPIRDGDSKGREKAERPRYTFDSEQQAIWEPVGDGAVWVAERIVDAQTGELRCTLDHALVPRLPKLNLPLQGRETLKFGGQFIRLGAVWGRKYHESYGLIGPLSSPTGTARGPGAISPYTPLLACLGGPRPNDPPSQLTVLEIRDLKQGQVVWSKELSRNLNRFGGFGGQPIVPTFVGNRVLVPLADRLFIVTVPKDVVQRLPTPLCLRYPKIGVVGVDKPLEVQMAALGGEGKLKFELTKAYKGIELDEDTGKVIIDLPQFWKGYINGPEDRSEYSPHDHRNTLDWQQTVFQRATGRPLPQDVKAFSVPLSVAVSDTSGQRDRLDLAVVALGPLDELREARDAVQAAEMRKQAKFARAREVRALLEVLTRLGEIEMPRPASPPPPLRRRPPEPIAPRVEDGNRVDQLDVRLRRMETATDALLRKIDRLEEITAPSRPAPDRDRREKPTEMKKE